MKLRDVSSLAAKRVLVLALTLVLVACANNNIRSAIGSYEQVRDQIQLGQSKEQVLALLKPTQQGIDSRYLKAPEQYREDETHVEVYFFRSQSFNDGIVTDDEFTPYVFEDGVLTAIGWTAIGGPKTQAQTRDEEEIHVYGRYGRYWYW